MITARKKNSEKKKRSTRRYTSPSKINERKRNTQSFTCNRDNQKWFHQNVPSNQTYAVSPLVLETDTRGLTANENKLSKLRKHILRNNSIKKDLRLGRSNQHLWNNHLSKKKYARLSISCRTTNAQYVTELLKNNPDMVHRLIAEVSNERAAKKDWPAATVDGLIEQKGMGTLQLWMD